MNQPFPHATREPLVQIGAFPAEHQARIDQAYRPVTLDQALADESLRTSVRGLLMRGNAKADPALIARLPALKIISNFGVGYDGVPLAAAREQGIVVTNTPGVLDAAVCELAVGLLLGLLREIPQSDRFVREGQWTGGAYALTTSLEGLRVGIVGLGRIGKGIARRLEPFGARIAYGGGRLQQDLPWRHVGGVIELAAESDVLILSCPGGEATRGLIDARVLAALDDGWLVNVSRGTVVEEPALIQALTNGRLRGAALDVFDKEPLGESPLRRLPKVLLSPHAGSATHQTRDRMLALALENLREVLAGRPAVTAVPL
ncbi:2-hydroxyacid dehydrogenase [Roseateles sp. YR242]|uniref:2-hydroxyacid dehydrogenase n=1 Tax=Roseateles sp. YR242 TaxID=1855305 RepID=UPI000B82EAC9|nr:2-hydroxyacid dehydrogenase [Roseateles sp. YR242]